MKSIFLKLKLVFSVRNNVNLRHCACRCLLLTSLTPHFSIAQTNSDALNSVTDSSNQAVFDYKQQQTNDSEFDNRHDEFSVFWRDANESYQDTVFGELVYNEPSTATKLEILRLLSKDTPSLMVFMHAVSMGLSIDEVLLAALEYEPEKARDLAGAAINLLPLLGDTDKYQYATYNLDGLERYVDGTLEERGKGYVERINENKPYSVQEVADNFFKQRQVLVPYPDWLDGQIHFMASAKELLGLQKQNKQKRWFHIRNGKKNSPRPIFVSLYEADQSILIDDVERVRSALQENPEAQLPVVFIYNRLRERAIDNLDYPATLHGIRNAYAKQGLLLTPPPEWQTGEYHAYVDINEFYQLFDIPEESDFEPEAWQKLLVEARKYDVNSTSLIVIMLNSQQGLQNESKREESNQSAQNLLFSNSIFAAWDNPRTESQFKYTPSASASNLSLDSLIGKGLVVNRPDLLAALNAIGVSQVPITVYYLDGARIKPYTRGPRSLIQAALGATQSPTIVVPGGGFLAPSPDLPPASPPGVP